MIEFAGLAFVAVFVVVEIVIHRRVRHLIARYDEIVPPPGLLVGQDAAERILARATVSVPVIEGDVDCYALHDGDRPRRHIQLADGRLHRRSLSAVVIAAHEAAHAIQHASGWRFFKVDLALAVIAFFAGPLGIALIAVAAATGWQDLSVAGAALFTICGIAGITRSVVEIDASRTALAELRALDLDGYDERAARRLLWWCGATYVSDSVFDVGAIGRRASEFGEDIGVGGSRGRWGDDAGGGGGGDGGGGSSGCGGGCGGGGGGG